jgi:hypothetical protein
MRSLFIFLIVFSVGFDFITLGAQGVFDSEDPLQLRLKGDVGTLFKDLSGKPKYLPFELLQENHNSGTNSLQIKVRTRGHFRREMGICSYPPLLLNFPEKGENPGIFQGTDKLKLVMPCEGERYLLREYYVYKAYQILNPDGLRVRLVKLTLEDTGGKKKKTETLMGFLLEEEEALVQRTGLELVERDLIRPYQTDLAAFLQMSIFQLMIGNTDWSIEYRQNIYLLRESENMRPEPIPYDFDHAGMVNAPYAKPAPELEMSAVTERRYRGLCVENMADFAATLDTFRGHKDTFFALYNESSILDEKDIKFSIQYLDEFFKLIDQPKKLETLLKYPCEPGGTSNVIIKGLKK